jgi:hypothetical protein
MQHYATLICPIIEAERGEIYVMEEINTHFIMNNNLNDMREIYVHLGY